MFWEGYFVALAIIVGAQMAMTRLYGWKGMAWATAVSIILIFGAVALSLMGLTKGRGTFAVIFLVLPTMIVLLTALCLAAFVKTE